ncbi:MAG TPA: LacI family DNA-binding transcriptional regulator [Ktedonobacteraceae bacterium]|nr:LacI family DNA-binding transcriptional regulator [Ktedonobacteraceae bacterium]
MRSKLTIQDVARLAGVSKATVSRVINQKTNVNPDTRERVLRVINEKGFVPSITASGLAGKKSRLIGVLAPPFTSPFVPEIMRGVAEVMEQSAYEMVLYSINPQHRHGDALDRIIGMRLTAGLLVILPGQLSRHLTDMHDHGLPIVVIDDQGPFIDLPWIGIDNRNSAYQATRHLIKLGHRRIAHLEGPTSHRCTAERYEGYVQALLEANITPDPRLVVQGEFLVEGGRACGETLFSMSSRERPTAIFSANDQMAFGLMEVAAERGICIPDDIAIVGFDDMPLSAYIRPTLTTVRQPFYEMGRVAIELLLCFIDSAFSTGEKAREWDIPLSLLSAIRGGMHEPIRYQLPTRLIVRESCGAKQPLPLSG